MLGGGGIHAFSSRRPPRRLSAQGPGVGGQHHSRGGITFPACPETGDPPDSFTFPENSMGLDWSGRSSGPNRESLLVLCAPPELGTQPHTGPSREEGRPGGRAISTPDSAPHSRAQSPRGAPPARLGTHVPPRSQRASWTPAQYPPPRACSAPGQRSSPALRPCCEKHLGVQRASCQHL